MQPLGKISPDASHDDLFIERYGRLLKWSLRFTDNNRELAEDLVHDAFIQFTFTHPDLQGIHDLDNYLYGMLRNLHLSQVRRATRSRLQPLSIVEYESVETGLRAIDPRDQIQVQEELRRACHYACARKERAKIASVLILRFFHGYYPSEIVQIMRSSHQAVRESLRIARTEAKLYVDNPKALGLIGFTEQTANVESFPATFARSTTDFLGELRRMIFQSRRGECLSGARLEDLYHSTPAETVDCHTLAHLVSCQICLDEVNRVLNLPLLSERYPTDTIGQDKRKKGGPGGGSTGGEGPGQVRTKYQRWKRDVFEHDPQELCVSVNGYLEGSQTISSTLSELTLSIKGEERVGFVEIFSEQNVRLLLLNIHELPPNGSDEQTTRVELSENRTLDLVLRFRSPWPTLHVTYHDPTYTEPGSLNLNQADIEPASTALTLSGADQANPNYSKLVERGQGALLKLWHSVGDWRFWLRPATVTVVCALLLFASLLIFYRPNSAPPASAEVLLERAAQAEDAAAARTDQVLHRTINFEERSAGGEILSRRRIEVWQSAEKGITARRLYDDRGALVAGDWRRADGVQTLYAHGQKPQTQLPPEKRGMSRTLTFESVWQLSPSAKEFSALIEKPDNARLEEKPFTYAISYEEGSRNAHGLVKATLSLSRADLHATEQTLFIQQDGELREYHFTEATFERHAPSAVAPSVFDPDPELIGLAIRLPDKMSENRLAAPTATTLATATAALEVEVIDALNNAGAFTGEQIDVSRTADGKLQINALVETDKRKGELIAALATVKNNPIVRINIETVAEAQVREARNKKSGSHQPGTVTTDQFTATESPVFNELRNRFGESEAHAFADRVVRRSIQARRHATALRQLSERFSPTDLASLSAADHARWLGLLRGHAAKFLGENEALQRELQTVFPDIGGGAGARTLDKDAEIQTAIRELYGLAVACDEDVRSSFALFTNAGASAEVKTAKFWRAMNTASALARSVQSAK